MGLAVLSEYLKTHTREEFRALLKEHSVPKDPVKMYQQQLRDLRRDCMKKLGLKPHEFYNLAQDAWDLAGKRV